MSVSNWFRRLFNPSGTASADAPVDMPGAPGVSPIADIEAAQAVDDVEGSTEAPSDPA